MATVLSSALTTKEDKDNQIDAGLVSGREKVSIFTYTAASTIADNTVILLGELPVNAKLTSVRVWIDDLGTTGDLNLGFYPGSKKASDIVLADALDEDALGIMDVNAAVTANVEQRFVTLDITTANDKVWDLATLTSQPSYANIFLAFTCSEVTTAAGDMTVIVRYTD